MEKACTNTAEAIIGKLSRQLHLVVYSYDFGLLPMIFLNSDFFSRPYIAVENGTITEEQAEERWQGYLKSVRKSSQKRPTR